jgi:hypothetical protein
VGTSLSLRRLWVGAEGYSVIETVVENREQAAAMLAEMNAHAEASAAYPPTSTRGERPSSAGGKTSKGNRNGRSFV